MKEPKTDREPNTLVDMVEAIRRERPFVNKKPFSHNIIGLWLMEIAKKYGDKEANKVIREEGLERLGWVQSK